MIAVLSTHVMENYLITLGYSIVTWLLFQRSSSQHEPPIRRAKFALLGMAFLCFGVGKTLLLFEVFAGWMFKMGHFSFIAFGLVYFLSSCQKWELSR